MHRYRPPPLLRQGGSDFGDDVVVSCCGVQLHARRDEGACQMACCRSISCSISLLNTEGKCDEEAWAEAGRYSFEHHKNVLWLHTPRLGHIHLYTSQARSFFNIVGSSARMYLQCLMPLRQYAAHLATYRCAPKKLAVEWHSSVHSVIAVDAPPNQAPFTGSNTGMFSGPLLPQPANRFQYRMD